RFCQFSADDARRVSRVSVELCLAVRLGRGPLLPLRFPAGLVPGVALLESDLAFHQLHGGPFAHHHVWFRDLPDLGWCLRTCAPALWPPTCSPRDRNPFLARPLGSAHLRGVAQHWWHSAGAQMEERRTLHRFRHPHASLLDLARGRRNSDVRFSRRLRQERLVDDALGGSREGQTMTSLRLQERPGLLFSTVFIGFLGLSYL